MSDWETVGKSSDGWEDVTSDWETVSPKTSVRQDIGIGFENLAHTGKSALDLLAGGLASRLGFTEDSDAIFADMEKRQIAREQEMQDVNQGTGGKVISGVTGIVPMVAAAPFLGPLAAAGGMAGMSALGNSTENVRKGASTNAAIVQAIGEAGMDTLSMKIPLGQGIVKGTALGTIGNVLSQGGADILGQQTMKGTKAEDSYQFDKDKYIVAGATGAVPGAVFGRMNRTGALEGGSPKPKLDVDPLFKPKGYEDMSSGERKLLEGVRKPIEQKVEDILAEIQRIETVVGREGVANPEVVKSLTDLEAELNKSVDSLASLEADIKGTDSPEVLQTRKQELIDRIKAHREKLTAENAEAFKPPSDAIEKTTPMETALIKIDEARKMTLQELDQRWNEAMTKLNELEEKQGGLPGEEFSALREALNREIDAYEALQRGEQPDLSWAKEQPKAEEITIAEPKWEDAVVETKPTFENPLLPTGVEVANFLRGKKNMGEVFDSIIKEGVGTAGQRKLLEILNRIPRIRSALFEFGTAIEKDGKFSTGAYDPARHTVELHKDGNIKTVLHEAVHAATHHILTDGKSVAAKRLIKLFEEFKQKNPDTEAYGMTDIHEFISEAFTNASFQKILAGIGSYSEGTAPKVSLYTKLKNIVKEALSIPNEVRTVFDDAIYAGSEVLELSRIKPESFFQKLSEKQQGQPKVADTPVELPDVKTLRGIVGRNFFGKNTMEGFYRDHPQVQKAFRQIREATEAADKFYNEIMYDTNSVINKGKTSVLDTLSKVKNDASVHMMLAKSSDVDVGVVHDLFQKGFEEGKDYQTNLNDNGGNLTDAQKKLYNKLSEAYSKMADLSIEHQNKLGKKHVLEKRAGWYPAKRVGNYNVEVSYRGNVAYVQSFKTIQAANTFRRKITDGTNLKHLVVSEVMEKGTEPTKSNAEMAEIIGEHLARLYPTAGDTIKGRIDALMDTMATRGGKLGHHHKHRSNLPGYKGSELFKDVAERGREFKEGNQSEINNFATNLRALIVKTKLDPYLNNSDNLKADPKGYEAVRQMYDSALGRNKELFHLDKAEKVTNGVVDKIVNEISLKAFGKEFEGKENSALGHLGNTTMRLFYATKMMAKPAFLLAQILTTPMVIPEMARDGHGIRAFYSFGKGVSKLMTGDKALWDHIKQISQEYNIMEPQFRESLNLEKHTGKEGFAKKVMNAMEDYVFLGKLGQGADSMSRLISYATAYTHFTDLGFNSKEASYRARLATDKAMNVYDTANAAPIFDKLGVIGHNMKPLSSFSLNQLGNFVSYIHEAKRGNFGPMIAYGLITTAMGGIISLPFIQDYERWRKIAEEYFDMTMPSILELMSGDESFLERLQITDPDMQNAVKYGVPAMSGIDLSSSMRSNETMFSIMAAIAMGQEDASKLLPVISATYDTVKQVPKFVKTVAGGDVSVAEGRKAVDSMISGPIGYGIKESRGLNETKFMGDNTGMLSTGKEGFASIPRTETEITSGLLGTRSIEQKETEQKMMEQKRRDDLLKQRKDKASNMFAETGKEEYLQKMVDLGMTEKQIQDAIGNKAYEKYVDQITRYMKPRKGKVNNEKAMNIFNFGVKKE